MKRFRVLVLIFSSIMALFLFQNFSAFHSKRIDSAKSIMIVNPKALAGVDRQVDFGYLLGRVAEWSAGGRTRTAGEFVSHPFAAAFAQQDQNSKLPPDQRIGVFPDQGLSMKAVIHNWMPQSELVKIKTAEGLRHGPFRLIAIANLLDAAGDFTDTGGIATSEPKALGELHLIYGLVDKNYENTTGKPFPQTLVLTYRLPVLKAENGVYVKNDKLTMEDLVSKSRKWRAKMRQWAVLWASLSQYELDSEKYQKHLSHILHLAIQPENFLALRSNVKINDKFHELRNWYVIQSQRILTPSRLRNEPYTCLEKSVELADIISSFWRPRLHDIEVRSYNQETGEAQGYEIYRDTQHWAVDNPSVKKMTSFSTCEPNPDKMPFKMYEPPHGVIKHQRLALRPPFVQVDKDFIWETHSQLQEARRHAFAIRTCSGCHSAEGLTNGFHIFPTLAGKEAKLSPFLTGVGKDTFQHGGASYKYNILAKRRAWLHKALHDDDIELYDSLLRPEMLH